MGNVAQLAGLCARGMLDIFWADYVGQSTQSIQSILSGQPASQAESTEATESTESTVDQFSQFSPPRSASQPQQS